MYELFWISTFLSVSFQKYVRPMLSTDEILEIYKNLKSSESTIWLPNPYYNVVKLRHFTHVGDDGNFALPDMFYDGVVYGLTWEHSHDNEVNFPPFYPFTHSFIHPIAHSIVFETDYAEGKIKIGCRKS